MSKTLIILELLKSYKILQKFQEELPEKHLRVYDWALNPIYIAIRELLGMPKIPNDDKYEWIEERYFDLIHDYEELENPTDLQGIEVLHQICKLICEVKDETNL